MDNELKTLNDLKIVSKNPIFNMGADEQRKWIKAEAIKWVKKFESIKAGKIKTFLFGDYINETPDLLIKFITNFFNLTEDDLK